MDRHSIIETLLKEAALPYDILNKNTYQPKEARFFRIKYGYEASHWLEIVPYPKYYYHNIGLEQDDIALIKAGAPPKRINIHSAGQFKGLIEEINNISVLYSKSSKGRWLKK